MEVSKGRGRNRDIYSHVKNKNKVKNYNKENYYSSPLGHPIILNISIPLESSRFFVFGDIDNTVYDLY